MIEGKEHSCTAATMNDVLSFLVRKEHHSAATKDDVLLFVSA